MMRIQDDADNGIQAPQQQQAQQQQGGQTSESDHYPGLNISAENLDVLKRNGTRRCFFFQTCFGFTSGSQNNFLHFLLRVLMVSMEKHLHNNPSNTVSNFNPMKQCMDVILTDVGETFQAFQWAPSKDDTVKNFVGKLKNKPNEVEKNLHGDKAPWRSESLLRLDPKAFLHTNQALWDELIHNDGVGVAPGTIVDLYQSGPNYAIVENYLNSKDWNGAVDEFFKNRLMTQPFIKELIKIRKIWLRARTKICREAETNTPGNDFYDPNNIDHYKRELIPFVTNKKKRKQTQFVQRDSEAVLKRIICQGFLYSDDN